MIIKEDLFLLKRAEFPLKDGVNPFKNGSPYLKGYFINVFTNESGEDFVAYIDLKTFRVWFAGVDMDWEWSSAIDSPNGYIFPWILNEPEKKWFVFVLNHARYLREQRGHIKN